MNNNVDLFCDLVVSTKVEDQMSLATFEFERTENMLLLYESIIENAKAKNLESELKEAFKIEFIALLLKFDRRRVLTELKRGKYPPTECLTECQNAKHELAIAYLKDRLGFTQEAIDIYKKRCDWITAG